MLGRSPYLQSYCSAFRAHIVSCLSATRAPVAFAVRLDSKRRRLDPLNFVPVLFLFVRLLVRLFACLYNSRFVCLLARLFVCLLVCLFACVCVCVCVFLLFCYVVRLFGCLFVRVFAFSYLFLLLLCLLFVSHVHVHHHDSATILLQRNSIRFAWRVFILTVFWLAWLV